MTRRIILVFLLLGTLLFVTSSDWSTKGDARELTVELNPNLQASDAFPVGVSRSGELSFVYNVEVTKELLADGELYVRVKEYRGESHEVELWIQFADPSPPRVRCLVHWDEDSGGTRGFVRDLRGTVQVRRVPSDAGAPMILRYELSGRQRGKPTQLRRTLAI